MRRGQGAGEERKEQKGGKRTGRRSPSARSTQHIGKTEEGGTEGEQRGRMKEGERRREDRGGRTEEENEGGRKEAGIRR